MSRSVATGSPAFAGYRGIDMSIWKKAIVNLQKGSEKFAAAAATVSERVKVELNIVRLRIRIDEVLARIDELHRVVGRKAVELMRNEAMMNQGEQLLKNEDIAAALAELVRREKELEDLNAELRSEQAEFKPSPRRTEETVA